MTPWHTVCPALDVCGESPMGVCGESGFRKPHTISLARDVVCGWFVSNCDAIVVRWGLFLLQEVLSMTWRAPSLKYKARVDVQYGVPCRHTSNGRRPCTEPWSIGTGGRCTVRPAVYIYDQRYYHTCDHSIVRSHVPQFYGITIRCPHAPTLASRLHLHAFSYKFTR
jgi:hypothetical protein